LVKTLITRWLGCVAILCIASAALAGPKTSLRLLYLGGETGRTRVVESFLKEHFGHVTVGERRKFDPAVLKDVDVVVLDWSQRDNEFPPKQSPLGPREAWTKPTVLLGSAGLHLAAIWEVKGGFG
jgi:hypothetical protein